MRSPCDVGAATSKPCTGMGSVTRSAAGAFSDLGGLDGMRLALQSEPTPSAVFVCSDYAAIGALAAIAEHGLRVPQDISVIGYDGTRLSAMPTVGLSTIAQPIADMGTQAAAMLADSLDKGEEPAASTLVSPRLVPRATTAAPQGTHVP